MTTTSIPRFGKLIIGAGLAAITAPALATNEAMMELLKVLHENGTINAEAYELIKNAAVADDEKQAAAGADVSKKVEQTLAQMGTPNLSPGKFEIKDKNGDFSWRVGGRLMYDATFFDNDGAFHQNDAGQFRRARMNVQGTMFTNWKYKFEYDFKELDKSLEGLKDAYFEYVGLKLLDKYPVDIKVGQSHEPFSIDLITSSNNSLFAERAMPVNTFAKTLGERNPGLKATTWGETWTAAVGAFATKQTETVSAVTTRCTVPAGGFVPGTSFNCTGTGGDESTPPKAFNDGYALTGRLTYVPWHDGGHVLHLGTALSYRDFLNGTAMRFREKPEADVSTVRTIDTGNYAADNFMRWNAELAVVEGPFTFQGEYLLLKNHTSSTVGDPLFDGFYVSAGWFLTGESRPYKFEDGLFDSVRPKGTVGKGGYGAWELVARYSETDLNDGNVTGGNEDNLTVGLNWFPTANIRLMADYVKVLSIKGGAFNDAEPAAFILRSHVFW